MSTIPQRQKASRTDALRQRLDRLTPAQRRTLLQRLRTDGFDLRQLPFPRNKRAFDVPRWAPLSFAQERLFFLHQLEPESPQLNLAGAFRLRGTLDTAALGRAFDRLVVRHEILRTSFLVRDEQPEQHIHAAHRCLGQHELGAFHDLCRLNPQHQEDRVRELARQQATTPFALDTLPLFRTRLLKLGAKEHVLTLTLHHIIADAWSLHLMAAELGRAYVHALKDHEAPSDEDELAPQYADFAEWQREWLSDASRSAQLDYWRAQLAQARPVSWHLDPETTQSTPLPGRIVSTVVPRALSNAATALIRRERLTLYMLLLSCFQLLLHRVSGEVDLCVGSSIANRPHPDLEKGLGFYVNLLVLRSRIADDPTVHTFLQRTRERVLGAVEHQDLPFEQIVEALCSEQRSRDQPFFRAFFVMHNAPRTTLELPGLSVEALEMPERAARYELSLRAALQEDGRIALNLEHDLRCVHPTAAERLLHHFETLLQRMVTHPEHRISQISLGEGVRILPAEHRSPAPPSPSTVTECFATSVSRHPDRPAVVTPSERVSYAALSGRATQIASRLAELGVGSGSVVALCLEPGATMVAAMLATNQLGAAYLPLDTEQPTDRSLRLARAAHAVGCLRPTGSQAWDPNEDSSNALEQLPDLRVEYKPLGADGRPRRPASPVAGAPAYYMPTSGSTGEPKIVCVSHENIVAYTRGLLAHVPLPSEARLLWVSGVAADLGYTCVWGALCSGRTLLTAPRTVALDADQLAAFTKRVRPDVLKIAPSQLWASLSAAEDPSALLPQHTLILGGEEADPSLLQRVRDLRPDSRLFNHYGPTEATVGVLTHALDPADWASGRKPPLGRSLPHVRAYVLDHFGQPLPEGMNGELALGGACLATGYANSPGLTAAAFVPDPHAGQFGIEAGARMYLTGDRVRYRQGRFEFLGRGDAQINLHGLRVEPVEIETALRALPDVRDARVGMNSKGQLCAFAMSAGDIQLDPQSLREQLAQQLPSALLPARCVPVSAWPLLPTGKLDWNALWSCAESLEASPPPVAPRTALEGILIEIWQSVLQRTTIGVLDDFFALGGDSIVGLQLVARAKRQGLHFTPKQLFTHSTIAALAPFVQRQASPSVTPTNDGHPDHDGALTPIQHWFFELPLHNPAHYNQGLSLALPEGFDPAPLEDALAGLVARHPALTQRFSAGPDGPKVLPPASAVEPRLQAVDLRRAPLEAARACCIEAQTGFDLSQGHLFKALHLDLGGERGQHLVLLAHHLCVDSVSWRVLLEDLQALYEGRDPGLSGAPCPIVAAHLEHLARSPEVAVELSRWRDLPRVPPLPRDSHGEALERSLAEHVKQLSVEQTHALLDTRQRSDGTPIEAYLLAALGAAVSRWSGEPIAMVEVEGHGRNDLGDTLDLSRTVGWLTCRFPIYIEAPDGFSSETARAVHAQLRSLPRGGIDYGLLRYLSDIGEPLRTQPFPEIVFNYLGQIDRGLETGPLIRSRAKYPATPSLDLGPLRDPDSRRSRLIAIQAYVAGKHLTLRWQYSRDVHRERTIASLSDHLTQSLADWMERR